MSSSEKIEYFSKILNRVANRESTAQFYHKFPNSNEQYYQGRQEVSNQDFLGIILGYDKETKVATVEVRNFFLPKSKLEIFGPTKKDTIISIGDVYNEAGEVLDACRHPKDIVYFKTDLELNEYDMIRWVK